MLNDEQISALKSDVQRAIGDSETAADISATLEKNSANLSLRNI